MAWNHILNLFLLDLGGKYLQEAHDDANTGRDSQNTR